MHRLAPSDLKGFSPRFIYRPDLRRVAEAAEALVDVPAFYAHLPRYPAPADLPFDIVELANVLPTRRGVLMAAVELLADVPAQLVAALIEEAPPRSLLPAMAGRVVEASRRRRAMQAHLNALVALEEGVSPEEALELVRAAA